MISSTQTHHPLVGITADKDAAQKTDQSEQFITRLKAAGLRHTQPRLAIFKAMQAFNEPVSIESIYQGIRSKSCDLVTVYRSLALFEELGLVRRCFSNNGTGLYELKREGAPVYYVTCRKTGARIPLDAQSSAELNAVFHKVSTSLAERGFQGVQAMVEFHGISSERNRTESAITELADGTAKASRMEAPACCS